MTRRSDRYSHFGLPVLPKTSAARVVAYRAAEPTGALNRVRRMSAGKSEVQPAGQIERVRHAAQERAIEGKSSRRRAPITDSETGKLSVRQRTLDKSDKFMALRDVGPHQLTAQSDSFSHLCLNLPN